MAFIVIRPCSYLRCAATAGCYVHVDVLGEPALVPGDCSPPGLDSATAAAAASGGDFAGSAPAYLDPAALHAFTAGAFIAELHAPTAGAFIAERWFSVVQRRDMCLF
jgi:hypothetical protein